MASVSNAFDALQSGAVASSKKKKRKNKKSTAESTSDAKPWAPRPLPSSHDLESAAIAAVTSASRLELWERWATELVDEETPRHHLYVDDAGRPAYLRNVLVASRAMESLAESCVEGLLLQEQGEALYRLFSAAFVAVQPEILKQLVMAIVKISTLAHKKNPEVTFAAKRAVRDVIMAVKKVELHGNENTGSMKKKPTARFERSSVGKKPFKHDKKAELHEALELVKSQQSAVDEVDDEESVGGASVSRSVLDFQVALSLASRQVEETTPSKKGRKKNKGGNQTSPLLESLKQEEAAHAAEEARLNEEISSLEMKLKALRSQLSSLHVTRQQVHQRKDAILHSLSSGQVPSNGAALISPEEQNEAIGCLEGVVAQLQSATGQSDEQKREFAVRYVDALERFYSLCFSRQEDLLKTVRFLKDSIQRRMEQEERMKEIASAALTKDILKTQQHSKHELEQQLKDAMFDSGDLIIKVTRVDSDLSQREDFIRKHALPHSVDALQTAAIQIKHAHNEIKQIAEEKKEIVTSSTPESSREPDSATKKRIDTKEIIKEEEMRAREEIAARMQPKKRTPTSSQSDPFSPKEKPSPKLTDVTRPTQAPPMQQGPPPMQQGPPPMQQGPPPMQQGPPMGPPPGPYQRVVYMVPSSEPLDPRFIRPPMGPPMYAPPPYAHHPVMAVHADPEVYRPVMQHSYQPPVNPAGPVQRPPPAQYDAPPLVSDAPSASSSKPRMAWKKIGDQTPAESDHPDLPTPGEARKLGKL